MKNILKTQTPGGISSKSRNKFPMLGLLTVTEGMRRCGQTEESLDCKYICCWISVLTPQSYKYFKAAQYKIINIIHVNKQYEGGGGVGVRVR